MIKHSGIAIGGPIDKQAIHHSATSVEIYGGRPGKADDPVWYDFHNIDGVGVWFVRGAALSDSLKVVLEAYSAAPKDLGDVVKEAHAADMAGGEPVRKLEPAHGGGQKATEQTVIQSMSERIEELKAINLKLEDRHTEDADALHQLRQIRIMCKNAGFIDDGVTIARLVDKLAAAHINLREKDRKRESFRLNFVARLWREIDGSAVSASSTPSQVSELEENAIMRAGSLVEQLGMVCVERDTANGAIRETLAELKSVGHKFEGRPLSDLVDIAIDVERHRHSASLKTIADALQMTFAIMPSFSDTAAAIANVIKVREKIQMPVQLAALERRISTLEQKPGRG